MNHIIHGCSHPKWRDSAYESEAEMFQGIQAYLERLVETCRQVIVQLPFAPASRQQSEGKATDSVTGCRPQRLLMIAIDGVAPQAKMCQQRTRRFMSAHTERLRRKIEIEVSSMPMCLTYPK